MSGTIRLDKWLWFARFFKSRTLCADQVQRGGFRVNTTPVSKASYALKIGDVLTFSLNDHVRVIKVEALGERRGPAPEAQTLYTDLDPPKPKPKSAASGPRYDAGGRPSKKDARALQELKRSALE